MLVSKFNKLLDDLAILSNVVPICLACAAPIINSSAVLPAYIRTSSLASATSDITSSNPMPYAVATDPAKLNILLLAMPLSPFIPPIVFKNLALFSSLISICLAIIEMSLTIVLSKVFM